MNYNIDVEVTDMEENKVVLCDDGKYRWMYRLDLKENHSVMHTVYMAVGICSLLPLVILSVIFLIDGEFINAMKTILPIYLLVMLVVAIITVVSYYAVKAHYGGAFTFLYEMDEEGIMFKRCEEDDEKTKEIGDIGAFIGAMTGNLGLVGTGTYMALSNGEYSRFSKVYSVKARPEWNLITVTSFMLFNSIYVNDEDYDFVLDYIKAHTGK